MSALPAASQRWRVAAMPAVKAAVVPFVVSRVIVLLSLELARYLVEQLRLTAPTAVGASHAGLLAWDATWYRKIAAHGYSGLPHGALRFYPLLPVVARAFGAIPGVRASTAVVLTANLAAFAAFALIYHLVVLELGDDKAARRSVWVLALAPSAFVLVMGYAESLLLVTTIVAFIGLRRRRYGWAIAAAFLAGLCRPVAVLLVVPAVIEAARNWRHVPNRERVLGLSAVAAAPLGAAAYLTWVQLSYGDFWLPLREQLSPSHRGPVANPISTLWHDGLDFVHRTHLGTAQHLVWAVVLVLLVCYLFWRLPSSYGWYAAATLVVALTAHNLDSLERYGLGCFPFAIAAGTLLRRQTAWWAALAVTSCLLVAYAVLAFLGLYVP